MKHTISIVQKASLILLGIFLCLFLLEVGLQIAGGITFLYTVRYHSPAVERLKNNDEYRIVCLGESTTFFGGEDSYPAQLERTLNSRNTGRRIRVINRGIPGANSAMIVSRLGDYLKKDKPDMVIAMIGVNEHRGTFVYKDTFSSKVKILLEKVKLYKLAKIMLSRISDTIEAIKNHRGTAVSMRGKSSLLTLDIDSKDHQASEELPNAEKDSGRNSRDYVLLGRSYLERQSYQKAEEVFKKALEINPEDEDAYIGLGWFYIAQKQYLKAEELFKKALTVNPRNEEAHIGLGYCYADPKTFTRTEEFFKKAIEINPESPGAYSGLYGIYIEQQKFEEAESIAREFIKKNEKKELGYMLLGNLYNTRGLYKEAEAVFKKAIEINPGNYHVYHGIGETYLRLSRYDDAEHAFKKSIEVNPRDSWGYIWLGQLYTVQRRYAEAEQSLRKGLEIDPGNSMLFTPLSRCYMQEQRYDKAEEILKQGLQLHKDSGPGEFALALLDCYKKQKNDKELEKIYESFIENYREIKEQIVTRGILFVCVQYPTLELRPLKEIFKTGKDVIFVDNEKIFKDAVNRDSYETYFTDRVGESFGHCTPKGNKLLAENIANAIIEKYFSKR